MKTQSILHDEKNIYGPQIQGAHWIDSKMLAGENYFKSINSSDHNDIVGSFPSAGKKEVELAIRSAKTAFDTWKKTPAPVRGSAINRLAKVLEREKEALAKIITREIGKPYREALGEVQEAIDTAHFFQSEGRRLYGQTVPSELPQKELMTYRRPLGVCLMITASNFPFAVPSWKLIPALLAGNTVIWKPSPDAPATALSFALCFQEAGFLPGCINVLFGGSETGELLLQEVASNRIQKVSFTGSTSVGRKIGETCGRALQNPSLELGGKNPLVVLADAPIEKAVSTSIVSCFGTAGQRCTSTGSIILEERVYDVFKKKFLEKVDQIRIGNPLLSDDVLYGPLFSQRYLSQFLEHLQWGKSEGASLIRGHGRITNQNPYPHFVGNPDDGWYVTPCVWENVEPSMRLFQEEIFGPSINLVKAKDFDHALELANATAYGLSSAIFTQDPLNMLKFKEGIEAGMTSVNNSTTGAEAHLPFGGTKASGNGTRESGIWVLESYTRWQAVNVDLSSHLQLAQMDVEYGEEGDVVSFKSWVK
jgi:aldehyde dehydrogenase (NAD+)